MKTATTKRSIATGTASPADPAQMLDMICEHFVEHGVVTRDGSRGRIDSPIGSAEFTVDGRHLRIRVDCPDADTLFTVKSVLAEHLFMFAGEEELELVWDGAPPSGSIPYFREAHVVAARRVTPLMQRVTFAVSDAGAFAEGGLHVRLLIPPAGRPPVWPTARPDGRLSWPASEDALTIRAYTIRAIDQQRGTIDIDFVLHRGGVTPAASWAEDALPGAIVGFLGPGGGGLPEARRLLIAGDETALPAIARMATLMPEHVSARIFIEVAGPQEEQAIALPSTSEITWLHRNGKDAGTCGLIPNVIRQALAGGADDDHHVWVACEHAEAKAIRRFLRTELRHDRSRHTVAAYWRLGQSSDTDFD
ncbi:siderophore-interacting protein [Sinorhizobium sp. BG8]|uniref:siderophore-interacting protein n=1 Tax=Sinorhizobium sp. BG8 TaxID=2613773 RepID=UPI001FEFF76E|nr:siderophore-interacting protein [Sinorhizobium sp. BG8]